MADAPKTAPQAPRHAGFVRVVSHKHSIWQFGSEAEGHRFLPGVNEVPDKAWTYLKTLKTSLAKKNKDGSYKDFNFLEHHIKVKDLEVLSEGNTKPFDELPAEQALELVKETANPELLEEWSEMDLETEVARAVRDQKDDLKPGAPLDPLKEGQGTANP